MVDVAQIWEWLAEVPDPEIPVISVTELGIVRDVVLEGDAVVVTVTPTYSGCPATAVINFEIERALREKGVQSVRMQQRLSPPWTTDWLTDAARDRLRAYGIAPPVDGTGATGVVAGRVKQLAGASVIVACPRCRSEATQKISQHGSTPCKAAYQCRDCLEPFDYFKCI